MILNPASDGRLNGTGFCRIPSSVIGGVLVSADGTNDATIVISENDANGKVIFSLVTKNPAFICAPMSCGMAKSVYVSCTGTGAGVFLYEWCE